MLILNEKKYAKMIYEGRINDIKSVMAKIRYVTRHLLYLENNPNEEKIYRDTVEWLKKNHDNFDESCYSNLISDAIKKAYKYPFYDIDKIKITQYELDKITSLNDLRAEKVLFVLLCMAKQQSVSNKFTNGLVKYSITELCKMARISVPAEDREYVLYNIVQHGFLGYPKKNNTQCLIVKFINDKDNDKDDVVLELDEDDCKELAYKYLKWKDKDENDEKYKKCECCQRLMKVSKKDNNRFCEFCTEIVGDVPCDERRFLCKNCGKLVKTSIFDNKSYRCDECQKKADYTPMETQIIECVDCHIMFEVDSSSRVIRCEECLKINNRKKRMKNYYKNKLDYICWFEEKCFLLRQNLDELENKGYELYSWDMLETPTLNYDAIVNFIYKGDKNIGCSVLAKRIWDVDIIPVM